MITLADRLSKIRALEKELPRKAAPIIKPGTGMYFVDWYVMGATQRTMAQSRGFRTAITPAIFRELRSCSGPKLTRRCVSAVSGIWIGRKSS